MEQERRHNDIQQQERAHPLKCPRCASTDTKFRYYNNHSLSQPRHYCRTCKRQWTVGGILRDIPIGGGTRIKQRNASSSRFGTSSSHRSHIALPSREQLDSSHYLTMDTTGNQPNTNLLEPLSPLSSFCFNDEISCLDAIQSLIQPEAMDNTVKMGNQFVSGSDDMAFLQDWDIQPMDLPQQIPDYHNQVNIAASVMIEPNHTYNQANTTAPYHVPDYNLVQPTWPNFLPQDAINNFNFSTSTDCLWSNTTDIEMPTTSINPNHWPSFPSYGPL